MKPAKPLDPTLNQTLTLSPAVHCADLDDSAVLLDSEKGLYFSVNETGAAIVRGLQAGENPQQIIDRLMAEFECSEDQARQDALAFLQALQQAGLTDE